MSKMNSKIYLTWDGFLQQYKEDKQTIEEQKNQETEFTEKYCCVYNYGKIQLLLVVLNKLTLFFGLFGLVLFLRRFIYLSRLFLHTFILFLFFDIFIDETTICIPLCDYINNMMLDEDASSYLKLNVSLSIELTDKKEEMKDELKEQIKGELKENDYEVIDNNKFDEFDNNDDNDDDIFDD
jgi:hypothetical protein